GGTVPQYGWEGTGDVRQPLTRAPEDSPSPLGAPVRRDASATGGAARRRGCRSLQRSPDDSSVGPGPERLRRDGSVDSLESPRLRSATVVRVRAGHDHRSRDRVPPTGPAGSARAVRFAVPGGGGGLRARSRGPPRRVLSRRRTRVGSGHLSQGVRYRRSQMGEGARPGAANDSHEEDVDGPTAATRRSIDG